MKLIPTSLLAAATLLAAPGCSKHTGPHLPVPAGLSPEQTDAKFVLMDPGAQRSVTTTGLTETRLSDGRLRVAAQLVNRENRRIQVQVQTVFKDAQGIATGDETPWENVILTENAIETVQFTSLNNQAFTYTIRVRQAR